MKWLTAAVVIGTLGCACDRGTTPSAESSPSVVASSKRASSPKLAAKADRGWEKVTGGKDLAGHLKKAIRAAKEAKRTPIAYLGASWCPPCAAIKKHRDDPQMKAAFKGVHIIEVDIDEWKKDEFAALGMKIGTVPVFFAIDQDGKATGKSIDGGAWGDNIPANMAPPLKKFFASL